MIGEIRQALAELELVSHAPVRNYDGRSAPSADDDIGGRRPSGGDAEFPAADELGAFRESYQAKTVAYFRAELARRGPGDALLAEIRSVVDAWKRAPLPNDPEYGSPQWKRYIAESTEDAGVLASRYWNPATGKPISRRYINMVRKQYRDLSAAGSRV